MTEKKKKPSAVLLVIGALIAGYIGYLINGAWTKGMNINELVDSLNQVFANPVADYYKGGVHIKGSSCSSSYLYDGCHHVLYKQKESDARQGIRYGKVCGCGTG